MSSIGAIKVLLMVVIPFVFVALIIPLIKKIAFHVGAIDVPNKRKVHNKPMPRLGGLGIYFGFLLGYMFFGEQTTQMNSILIGSFILVITGIIDDIKPLSAKHKLIGQVIAALIVVFYGRILIEDFNFFGLKMYFTWSSYPLTILLILGLVNCMNLIDGLDGLAGGISSIFFLTIGIIAVLQGRVGLTVTITFIMLGSSLGFLVHNFNPAKIFMGDSGSMFLGFIISIITILGFKSIITSSIIIPLCILVVPILDTMCAIIRRKLKGESIGTPDKSHFHHQLLRRNFGVKGTVLFIYLITTLFSTTSIIWLLFDSKVGYIMYSILMFLLIIFVFKTDILVEHKKNKRRKKHGKS